jgi:hypothetical protein
LGDDLQTVWDWDSVISAPEASIAGLAAAVYPATGPGSEASVQESEAFLLAYETARGAFFSKEERQEAWAAGIWNRSFDAKEQLATEGEAISLTEGEAVERWRRAGRP